MPSRVGEGPISRNTRHPCPPNPTIPPPHRTAPRPPPPPHPPRPPPPLPPPSPASTAVIPPPPGSPCINRPRAATSLRASSTENTPATHAATYSPTLWPITADGSIPQLRHSSDSAHSSANSAGCVYPVSSSGELSPPFGYITSKSPRPSTGRNTSSQRSSAFRNAGCVS